MAKLLLFDGVFFFIVDNFRTYMDIINEYHNKIIR